MPRPKPKQRIVGAGIDLVSLPRFEKFLKEHRKKAISILFSGPSPKNKSAKALARVFAAKEAVFKCLDRSWMGIEGFQAIQIQGSQSSRFRVKSTLLPKGAQAEGVFFEGEGWVGAQAMVWK